MGHNLHNKEFEILKKSPHRQKNPQVSQFFIIYMYQGLLQIVLIF